MKNCTTVLLLLLFTHFLCAQNVRSLWTDIAESTIQIEGERQLIPKKYRTIALDVETLKTVLNEAPPEYSSNPVTLALPMPDGTFQEFAVTQSPIMAPALGEKYPFLKTYSGQGITQKSATVRLDVTHKGFHAMILGMDYTVYIDPYMSGSTKLYNSYFKKDFEKNSEDVYPEIPPIAADNVSKKSKDSFFKKNNFSSQSEVPSTTFEVDFSNENTPLLKTGGELRTYRLAVSTTGEYAQFHGGTKPDALAAIVTTMNRVNGIYERDIAVRMELVANNDVVIFLDSSTDPFTNANPGALIDQNKTVIDSLIGPENYDIGHNFNTGGGGLAQLNSPCGDNKARGVSGIGNPIGDPFNVDYVCHEIGHQFGAPHTFNGDAGSCGANRSGNNAYEPGSGSTIMAYSGICAEQNIQTAAGDYFHRGSLDEMIGFTTEEDGDGCPVKTPIGNNPPIIEPLNVQGGYDIPYFTPFILSASASDPDGDEVTYCWEQFDLGPAGHPFEPVGDAAIFRSLVPTVDSFRVFPRMSEIVNNDLILGEILPTYSRTLNFRLTVRDNRVGGGCISDLSAEVNVIEEAGPFRVMHPNDFGVAYAPNSSMTVLWNVANTNEAPVNCAMVNILLSADGGYTYPTVLAQSMPNVGAAVVTVPEMSGSDFRIKVEAADNIFFDISDTEFTILDNSVDDFVLNVLPANQTICATDDTDFDISLGSLGGFTDMVTVSVEGLPDEANGVFPNGEITMELEASNLIDLTISNLSSVLPGNYPLTITAEGGGMTHIQTVELVVEGERYPNPGNALFLDGDGDYVAVSPINLNDNYVTMSAWIKPTATVSSTTGLIFSREGPTTAGMTLRNGNELGFIWDGSGGTFASELFVPENEWSHVAMVVSPVFVKLYVNGQEAVSAREIPIESFNGELRIGNDANFSDRFFSGWIDEVKIFKKALNQQEVRAQMHLTENACEGELLSYFQFNEIDGEAIDGVSGYNGILMNDAVRQNAAEPAGTGISFSQNVEMGLVNFINTGLIMDFTTPINTEMVVSKINLAPNDVEGIADGDEVFDSQYWVVNHFEEELNGAMANMIFSVSEALSEADELETAQLILYSRPFNEDGEWTLAATGSNVNAGSGLVTFNFVEAFTQAIGAQFLIARTSNPIISTTPTGEFCNAAAGTVSDVSSYEVSAINLVTDLVILPPDGFEISLSETADFVGAGGNLILSQVDGKVEPTTIYVRFLPNAVAEFEGDIQHLSANAITRLTHVRAVATDIRPGNALSLDGGGDRVQVNALNLNSNTVTMSAWIRPEGAQTDFAGIIFSRTDETTAGISLTELNELRYHWNNGGWPFTSNLYVPSDQWSYVALVITPDSATLYLNGVASTDFAPQEIEEFEGQLRIGHDRTGPRFFKGLIDEVKIWNRALTTTEIREKMHLTTDNCKEEDMVLYFQFNEADGDAINYAGNLNGQFVNDATRTEATLPIGGGTASTQNEVAGTVTFTTTDLTADYNNQSGAAVVASKINLTPYSEWGLDEEDTYLNSQYWAVNRFGIGTFNANMTFTVAENLDDLDEAIPERIELFTRNSTSDIFWARIASASSVNSVTNSATFNGVNNAGQFLVVRSGDPSVGVENGIGDGGSVKVYPNPAYETVFIDVALDKMQTVNYAIYNALGQKVAGQTSQAILKEKWMVDVSGFLSGVYMVLVETEEGQFLEKVVKW